MSRWALGLGAALVLLGLGTVALARVFGKSGSRASILVSVVSGWLAAWVLWSFAGGLAARYGLLAVYDGTLFAALALAGGVWQYRAHVRAGREQGLAVFVGGQLIWLVFVLARNGALAP